MNKIVRGGRAILQQWPHVVAESLGVRAAPPLLPAFGPLPSADEWKRSCLAASWLGHATALLRAGGVTLLTDPHFEERIGLRVGGKPIGRRRGVALPGDIADLPPIDIVLLSHAHLDHWDRATLKRLARRETIAVIPSRTHRLLPKGFGDVVELTWDREKVVAGLRLTAIKPRHWGARYLIDRRRGYNSYLIEDGVRRIVYGGDTALTTAFDALGRGPGAGVDLAVLGIGNSDPWEHHHATPEQAALMAERMGARRLMPIHHSTFFHREEASDTPLLRLLKVWPSERVVCSRVGESWFDRPMNADAREAG
ncbi:MAG: MBL fold metallo-hydrolase [Phycisphaerae bacterium]|nr:MBL fold metallo-hydrolase [Phycisphaerae bacterium]